MKKLMSAALKEAVRAAVSAFLAALGLAASVSATGCTINIPAKSGLCESVNGGVVVELGK